MSGYYNYIKKSRVPQIPKDNVRPRMCMESNFSQTCTFR